MADMAFRTEGRRPRRLSDRANLRDDRQCQVFICWQTFPRTLRPLPSEVSEDDATRNYGAKRKHHGGDVPRRHPQRGIR